MPDLKLCNFSFEKLAFSDYVSICESLIANAHSYLATDQRRLAVLGNRPFYWQPEPYKALNSAVLLIHGLYDSPYIWHDLAKQLHKQGHAVLAILLPGHGTRPEDLLNVKYSQWVDAVSYAIRILKNDYSNVVCCGFSLGSALAIDQALKNADLSGLILLAPAIRTVLRFSSSILYVADKLSCIMPSFRWYRIRPQTNLYKYNSFTVNAAYQTNRLMHRNRWKTWYHPLKLPIFGVSTLDDAVVRTSSAIRFFEKAKHPNSHMVLYTKAPLYKLMGDSRFTLRNSHFPEQHVLDFSHVALPISPANPYYGINGQYKDFDHYRYMPKAELSGSKAFLGALTDTNLRNYLIQRLTYNPDFDYMLKRIEQFLQEII